MKVRPLWPAILTLALLTAADAAPIKSTAKAKAPSHPAGPVPVLLLDGQGNGLLKTWESRLSSGTGTAFLGVDIRNGLAILKSHIAEPKSRDVALDGYLEATDASMIVRGAFKTALPPGGKPLTLKVHGDWQSDTEQWSGHGKADAAYASGTARPVSSVLLEGKTTVVGYQTGDSSLHFAMGGDLVKGKIEPEFRSLDVVVSQADDLTAVTASLVLPPTSSMAADFKGVAANPADSAQKLSDALKKQGFNVDSVSLTNVRANDTEVGADLKVGIKGFGGTLESLVQTLWRNVKGTDVTPFQQGLDEIMQMRLETGELHVKVENDSVDATMQSHVTHLDRLVVGYVDVYQALLGTVSKSMPTATPKTKQDRAMADFMLRAAHISLQRLRELTQVVAGSTDQQSYAFQVQYSNDGKSDAVHATTDLQGTMQAVVHAAQAVQYPLLTSQTGHLDVQTDDTSLHGTLDLSSSGPWLDAIKIPYVMAAQQTPGMENAAALLQTFGLTDSRAVVSMHEGTVAIDAYAQTSGLGPVVDAVMRAFEPLFKGSVTALQMNSVNPHGVKDFNQGRVYFSGLPVKAHDALVDLLQLSGLRDSTHPKVQTATASQMALPSLAKPEIVVPPALQPTNP